MKPIVPTYYYFQGCYNPEFEAEIAKTFAMITTN